MLRCIAIVLVLSGCGNLEDDRICIGHPCGGQSDVCKAFIRCSERTGSSAPGTFNASFGPKGVCWTNETLGSSCTVSCESQLQSLRASFPSAGC